jgi:hypothetical protein
VVHDRADTPFQRYDTAVERDAGEARLEAAVNRLEAALDRLEAKMARLERTVRWWIMTQMVCGPAGIAVYLSLTGRLRERCALAAWPA